MRFKAVALESSPCTHEPAALVVEGPTAKLNQTSRHSQSMLGRTPTEFSPHRALDPKCFFKGPPWNLAVQAQGYSPETLLDVIDVAVASVGALNTT